MVCCTAALEMKRTACATDGSTAAGGGAAGALGGGEAAAVAAAAAGTAGAAAGLMVGASDEAPGSEPRSQGLAFGGAGAAGAANAAGAVGPAAAGGAAGSRDVASSMAVSPIERRDVIREGRGQRSGWRKPPRSRSIYPGPRLRVAALTYSI